MTQLVFGSREANLQAQRDLWPDWETLGTKGAEYLEHKHPEGFCRACDGTVALIWDLFAEECEFYSFCFKCGEMIWPSFPAVEVAEAIGIKYLRYQVPYVEVAE